MELSITNKKDRILIGLGFLFLLGASAYMQFSDRQLGADGSIQRAPVGGSEKHLDLTLKGDQFSEDYPYPLTVEPTRITQSLAEEFFAQAREEIDTGIFAAGEDSDHVQSGLQFAETYVEGLVKAEWYMDDYTYLTPEGEILQEKLTEEQVVNVSAELTCGEFHELYVFPVVLHPKEKTLQEKLLVKIRENLRMQYDSGSAELTLPTSIEGSSLIWQEKKQPYLLQTLLLEMAMVGLMFLVEAERKREAIRKREELLKLEYPELVSHLAVLMGAGSSLKSAWSDVARRYLREKQQKTADKPLYEEVVRTYHEMADGEGEIVAYRKFGERCGCACCLRLSRLFIQNLQKGNAKLCEMLREEAENSFEERKLAARKAGEEAGTRLLFPLLLMMAVVMAIVIMPAILNFNM